MSTTSEALVQLAEQKEQLRIIANRYLDSADRLPVDCTLQDIIDVLNEYDEYTYMNALFNSIEVFPDKDYSINDTEGHIKGLRPYAFYNNTALKSVKLPNVDVVGYFAFYGCTNLEKTDIRINRTVRGCFAGMYGKVILRGLNSIPRWIFTSGDYGANAASITSLTCPDTRGESQAAFACLSYLKNLNLPKFEGINYSYTFQDSDKLETILLGGICAITNANIGFDTGSALKAMIFTNENGLSMLGGTDLINNLLLPPNAQFYVPSALLTQYQSATNWTLINDERPIQDIESHINDLRGLGADFSFTPYANKKWDSENQQLVIDSSIGEEVDE
jgi:hypothetical protein